jgi:hypothetical protein
MVTPVAFRDAIDRWSQLSKNGSIPEWMDVDPSDFRSVLDNSIIADVDGNDAVVTIAGKGFESMVGASLYRRRLSSVWKHDDRNPENLIGKAAKGVPNIDMISASPDGREKATFAILMMPFRRGERLRLMLTMAPLGKWPSWLGLVPSGPLTS